MGMGFHCERFGTNMAGCAHIVIKEYEFCNALHTKSWKLEVKVWHRNKFAFSDDCRRETLNLNYWDDYFDDFGFVLGGSGREWKRGWEIIFGWEAVWTAAGHEYLFRFGFDAFEGGVLDSFKFK